MENTLHAARADDSGRRDTNVVELTAAGRMLIIAAIVGACFAAWRAYERFDAADAPVAASRPAVPRSAQPSNTNGASAAQLTQALLQERSERSAQAAAWRAVSETNRQQIATLEAQLQAVESKMSALQKAPQPAHAPREGLTDAVSSAKVLHQTLDAAKSTAQIDVASLPVETVSAQSLNLTSFGSGTVEMAGQKLAVGQPLQPGETIVAIDPVSRSIVTNRRILNVTN